MSFYAEGGRIHVVDDAAGHTVFDTDERAFVLTDFIDSAVVGAHVTPSRTSSSASGARTDVNVSVDTTIAAINAAATTIFGAFKVTVSGFTPMGAGGWFVGNGSYLHGQFTMGLTDENQATHFHFVSGAVVYTFRCSGGNLIFNESVFMRSTFSTGGSVSQVMPATTVDFRIFCGLFL